MLPRPPFESNTMPKHRTTCNERAQDVHIYWGALLWGGSGARGQDRGSLGGSYEQGEFNAFTEQRPALRGVCGYRHGRTSGIDFTGIRHYSSDVSGR